MIQLLCWDMAGGVSSVTARKSSWGLMSVLASAFLECLLIFVLFIDAIVAYSITKFARYCELPIPCLLCSRLDHVLGRERVGFYWDLICGNHKSEISSLVYCNFHDKLVDVHEICENCLFSFATKDKSNAETFRLLVGKLGAGPDIDIDEAPSHDNHGPTTSSSKRCSCCNELLSSMLHAQKLLHLKSSDSETADLDLPLFTEFGIYENNNRKSHWSVASSFNRGSKEFKITTDKESEDQITENEDSGALLICKNDCLQEDIAVESVRVEQCITTLAEDSTNLMTSNLVPLYDNKDSITLICEDKTPQKDLGTESDIIEHHDGSLSVASTSAIGHGLEELNWIEVDSKAHPAPLPEFISVNNIPESSNFGNASVDQLKNSDIRITGDEGQTLAVDSAKIHGMESEQITADAMTMKMRADPNDIGLQMPNCLKLSDAYKLAESNRGRQLSGKQLEQHARKDSPRVSEGFKLLLTQLSSPRGFELPLNMISPRVSENLEELKTFDSSASIGMRILQKRLSLERNDSRSSLDRNESGSESFDLSIVSEIEGESEVDRWKRQVEHDRKLISALCKELEEERNASAIAANEAMAMITRLQEEKATLQMEALHDLRLMEDQGEYDMEALEKLNDLLTEKEKEIQDLEAELDYYRMKFPDESLLENITEPTSNDRRSEKLMDVTNHSAGQQKHDLNERKGLQSGENSKGTSKDPWSEFEDEKLYISQCLNKLEEKLHLFSENGVNSELTDGDCFGNGGEDLSDSKWHKEGSQRTIEMEENNVLPQTATVIRCAHSCKSPKYIARGSLVDKEHDVVALGYEVSSLNDRLRALEDDRNFLEHAINLLRNGDEGLHFIEEIATHLKELRRIGITRQASFSIKMKA
ncbi:hypothetical protein Nepgr_001430 [Nepenthes gracilis]|uniref:GTD-binding domain-containing protein n=1 Tax=Nepenthes gracilis TaxID=150966 RepID=A0AAD3P4G6_NEPGR|nr:hypothetical protein Nepgr_001430 [Nepenthes gracilis]